MRGITSHFRERVRCAGADYFFFASKASSFLQMPSGSFSTSSLQPSQQRKITRPLTVIL